MNKETKRTWLEEIRQLSNDSEFSEDELLFVDEAVLATVAAGPSLEGKQGKDDDTKSGEATLLLSLKQGIIALAPILTTIDVISYSLSFTNLYFDFIFEIIL